MRYHENISFSKIATEPIGNVLILLNSLMKTKGIIFSYLNPISDKLFSANDTIRCSLQKYIYSGFNDALNKSIKCYARAFLEITRSKSINMIKQHCRVHFMSRNDYAKDQQRNCYVHSFKRKASTSVLANEHCHTSFKQLEVFVHAF